VVLISGFTHPLNEFTTPYRVINYHFVTAVGTIRGSASITKTSRGAPTLCAEPARAGRVSLVIAATQRRARL